MNYYYYYYDYYNYYYYYYYYYYDYYYYYYYDYYNYYHHYYYMYYVTITTAPYFQRALLEAPGPTCTTSLLLQPLTFREHCWRPQVRHGVALAESAHGVRGDQG